MENKVSRDKRAPYRTNPHSPTLSPFVRSSGNSRQRFVPSYNSWHLRVAWISTKGSKCRVWVIFMSSIKARREASYSRSISSLPTQPVGLVRWNQSVSRLPLFVHFPAIVNHFFSPHHTRKNFWKWWGLKWCSRRLYFPSAHLKGLHQNGEKYRWEARNNQICN